MRGPIQKRAKDVRACELELLHSARSGRRCRSAIGASISKIARSARSGRVHVVIYFALGAAPDGRALATCPYLSSASLGLLTSGREWIQKPDQRSGQRAECQRESEAHRK